MERYAADPAEGEEEKFLEVLPLSGIIWESSLWTAPDTSLLARFPVADVPKVAHIAAQWLLPAQGTEKGRPQAYVNRRSLSTAEVGEVRRLRHGLIWNGWLILYAYDVFYFKCLWDGFHSARVVTPVAVFCLVLTGLLAYAHRRPWFQLRLATHLTRDIASSSALILRYGAGVPAAQVAVADTERGDPSVVYPVLCATGKVSVLSSQAAL